jgi:hypothetical protein
VKRAAPSNAIGVMSGMAKGMNRGVTWDEVRRRVAEAFEKRSKQGMQRANNATTKQPEP